MALIGVVSLQEPVQRWLMWLEPREGWCRTITYREGSLTVVATRDPDVIRRLRKRPGVTMHDDIRPDRPETKFFVFYGDCSWLRGESDLVVFSEEKR